MPIFRTTKKSTLLALLLLPLACSNLSGKKHHGNSAPAPQAPPSSQLDITSSHDWPAQITVGSQFQSYLRLIDRAADKTVAGDFSCVKGCPKELHLGLGGWLSWIPDTSQIGDYELVFAATDSVSGQIAQTTLKLKVIPDPKLSVDKQLAFVDRDNVILTGTGKLNFLKATCLVADRPVTCPSLHAPDKDLIMHPAASDPALLMIVRIKAGDSIFDAAWNFNFLFMEEAPVSQGLQIGYSRDRSSQVGVASELNATCRGGDKVVLAGADPASETLISTASKFSDGMIQNDSENFVRSTYHFAATTPGHHTLVITCSKDAVTIQHNVDLNVTAN